MELGRRCSFLPSACCNCSYKEGIHLRMAFGDKTEVNGIRIGPPLFEPEEEASVISEAFKVWVTILAFIVQKICDPERLESLRVNAIERVKSLTVTMTWSSIEFLLVVLERGVYQRPLTVSVSGLADQAFSDTPWGRAEGQP
jgi:hypothetical protein